MHMMVEAMPGQKLYRAVVDALRREIETGRFAEMQLLPAERVLCELLDVSRTTLRKAIADLVTEGVLLHRHGAGTFIHRARLHVDQPSSRLTSFTEDMQLRGLEASSRELERGVFLPTPEEAMMLGAGPNERVFRLGRLRLPGGFAHAGRGAAWAGGFKPTRGLQRLRATLVSEVDAELLGVARDSPALHIQRIAYLTDGSCVEFTKSLYRADTYDFVSELTLSPPVARR